MRFLLTFVLLAVFGLPKTAFCQELKPLEINIQLSEDFVQLGKQLFFDGRLSGDATISCATCHDPSKAFTDGLPLSVGYPGSRYFRNTPTLINASQQTYFYWDGRMSGDDLPSLVRDHIAEAHFMQADGRLIIERLRQIPEYESAFKRIAGGEPSYGKILGALTSFVQSLQSADAPIDRFLKGDKSAFTDAAKRGYALFIGKADCVRCHHGAMLSDGDFHATGAPTNADVFKDPLRHITFRRFYRTIGIGECESLREDIGLQCVTKEKKDRGKFRTAALREVSRTAPYMHNGSMATLEQVVAFYNEGGGSDDDELEPLDLTDTEQMDLVEFLKRLSGEPMVIQKPELPDYQLRALGDF